MLFVFSLIRTTSCRRPQFDWCWRYLRASALRSTSPWIRRPQTARWLDSNWSILFYRVLSFSAIFLPLKWVTHAYAVRRNPSTTVAQVTGLSSEIVFFVVSNCIDLASIFDLHSIAFGSSYEVTLLALQEQQDCLWAPWEDEAFFSAAVPNVMDRAFMWSKDVSEFVKDFGNNKIGILPH